MRLLHTEELYLAEFLDDQIPNYAILSHRWEEDEVSLQDFEQGQKKDGGGYRKILNCCALAKSQEFEWVWIDTCCIDKKSSAELSEAINSMFRWYENAKRCYAYLSDVRCDLINGRPVILGFERSKWFTRGWTLQELLAPREVRFLDRNWQAFGTRSSFATRNAEYDLSKSLSEITGIPARILERGWGPAGFYNNGSVAQRMSWASKRKTSRVEDMAYCLLGLFNINMPLLYGEGAKAFVRLQQEIIQQSEDESVFAWSHPDTVGRFETSLFAPSPSYFGKSGVVERRLFTSWIKQSPYRLTDNGLQMDVLLVPPLQEGGGRWLLPLNCTTVGRRNAIILDSSNSKSFARIRNTELSFVGDWDLKRDFDGNFEKQRLQCRWPEAHEISAKNPERKIYVGRTSYSISKISCTKATPEVAERLTLSKNAVLKDWGL